MSAVAHQPEDKLLDLVYGELPDQEARAIEAHLASCAKCQAVVTSFRAVRKSVGRLPAEPAPDTGLESLLAYAEQSARRVSAGPAPRPVWWRRWLGPVAGAVAVGLVAVVAFDVSKQPGVEKLGKLEEKSAEEYPRDDWANVAKRGDQAMPSQVAQAPTGGPAPTAAPAAPAAPGESFESALGAKGAGPGVGSASSGELVARERGKLAMKDLIEASPKSAEPPKKVAAQAPSMAEHAQVDLATGPSVEDEAADKVQVADRRTGSAVGGLEKARGGVARDDDGAAREELARASGKTESVGASGGYGGVGASAPAAAPPPSTRSSNSLGMELGSRGEAKQQSAWAKKSAPNRSIKLSEGGADPAASAKELESGLTVSRKADAAGDWRTAIQASLDVLGRGATGYQRAEALKRVCDGYDALGQEDRATPYCEQLMREFSSTAAAKLVAKRRAALPGRAREQTGEARKAKSAPAEVPADVDRGRAVESQSAQ